MHQIVKKILIMAILMHTITNGKTSHQSSISQNQTEEIWLNIFIHGIISVKPFISFSNVVRFMNDNIGDSIYARAIEILRKDPLFQQYHIAQNLGMQLIDMQNIQEGAASRAFARSYDQLINHISPCAPTNLYYTYGWSGLLSQTMRILEAELLYRALLKEITSYHAQNINPRIRIIGYSHGGNIALNIAQAKKSIFSDISIIVDELILIGVPVMQAAIEDMHDPIFKKIYHIYSHGDRIQKIDLLSVNLLFSRRTFNTTKYCALPDKLKQIDLRVFRLSKHCKRESHTYHDAHCLKRHHIRKAHPGHTELWSFGWVPCSYRDYFPLYPLPTAILTPLITHLADQHPGHQGHVRIEVHPYNETVKVFPKKSCCSYVYSYLEDALIMQMKHDAELFRPLHLNTKTFDEYLCSGIRKAQEQKKMEWEDQKETICSKNIQGV